MPADPFSRFLVRSMGILKAEQPRVNAELGDLLRDREAHVEMDGHAVCISFKGGAFALADTARHPFIELRSSRAAVLSVMAGQMTLEAAIWTEAVWVRGTLQNLVLFHAALVLYLQGAIRCPSFPSLLREYRQADLSSFSRKPPSHDPRPRSLQAASHPTHAVS